MAVTAASVKFQFHAPQGVAATFIVGGKHGAANQFSQQSRRDFIVIRLLRTRLPVEIRQGFSAGQAKLTAFASDDDPCIRRTPGAKSGRYFLARIDPNLATDNTAAPGSLNIHSLYLMANANLQIGRQAASPFQP